MSLDGNHSDMVKFSEFDRNGYEKVCDVLKVFVKLAPSVIKARNDSLDGKNNRIVPLFFCSGAYMTSYRAPTTSEADRVHRRSYSSFRTCS